MIRVAHSPDADDAFMFYALITGKIDAQGIEFENVLADIETLNQKALKGEYEVSAISLHAYPYVADKYYLLSSGGSVGYKYGPVVVSKKELGDLKGKRIAIPGVKTTAFLALKLLEKDFEPIVTPFDKILETVERGKADAGLVIHEGQLTYSNKKLLKVVDLGEWWYEETGLPLPLGGNVIRKDLDRELSLRISGLIRESIEYGLNNREEALSYASKFAGDLEIEKVDEFVGMYVNERTLDYGDDGIKAIRLLLERGYKEGIITLKPKVEILA
jgi:1,4-dihydroxy-6-naphthoate synthase